jgi:hypothetical protein
MNSSRENEFFRHGHQIPRFFFLVFYELDPIYVRVVCKYMDNFIFEDSASDYPQNCHGYKLDPEILKNILNEKANNS